MLSTKQRKIKKRDETATTTTTTKQKPNEHTETATEQNHKKRYSFHDGCFISFYVPQTLSFAKSALPTASIINTLNDQEVFAVIKVFGKILYGYCRQSTFLSFPS